MEALEEEALQVGIAVVVVVVATMEEVLEGMLTEEEEAQATMEELFQEQETPPQEMEALLEMHQILPINPELQLVVVVMAQHPAGLALL